MTIPKSILLTIVGLLVFKTSRCQVKEIIDRDIVLIKEIPFEDPLSKPKVKSKQFKRKNREFLEILALDTLAIPYLVDRMSDTTQTSIRIPCATHLLKTGDVAFALLSDIILIPWYAAFGIRGDSYGCDMLPDGGWEAVYTHRLQLQKQLKIFFASEKGKVWVRLAKEKMPKSERDSLFKKI